MDLAQPATMTATQFQAYLLGRAHLYSNDLKPTTRVVFDNHRTGERFVGSLVTDMTKRSKGHYPKHVVVRLDDGHEHTIPFRAIIKAKVGRYWVGVVPTLPVSHGG
jgi:hypothetical protein